MDYFKAPYNFIPLNKNVLDVKNGFELEPGGAPVKPWASQDACRPGLFSGSLDLEITTESPMYIRCGVDKKDDYDDDKTNDGSKDRNKAKCEFFNHGDIDNPFIPGSSIRGMTRAMLEILSQSRMSFVSDDKRFVYRALMGKNSLATYYKEKMLDEDAAKDNKKEKKAAICYYPSEQVKAGYLNSKGSITPAVEHTFSDDGKTIRLSFLHVDYAACGKLWACEKLAANRCWTLTRNECEDYKKPAVCPMHNPRCDYNHNHDIKNVYVKLPESLHPKHKGSVTLKLAYVAKSGDVLKEKPVNDNNNSFVKACVVRSGHMTRKHMHCAVFARDENRNVSIPDEVWKRYKDDHDAHNTNTRKDSKSLKSRPLITGEPVFYILDNDDPSRASCIGPTMFFRIPYVNTVAAAIPNAHKNNNSLDMAEALFGRIADGSSDDPDKQIRGRVSFSDAKCKTDKPFLDYGVSKHKTPRILGGPKPTSFQAYLKQPDSLIKKIPGIRDKDEWNTAGNSGTLRHWDSPGAQISGFKRYWVQEAPSKSDQLPNAPSHYFENDVKWDSQHTVIRPLRKDVGFKSQIRFFNLAPAELGALLACLNIPDNMRHSLGMGKPLGMGAVKMTANLRICDPVKRYSSFVDEDGSLTTGEQLDKSEIIKARAIQAFVSLLASKGMLEGNSELAKEVKALGDNPITDGMAPAEAQEVAKRLLTKFWESDDRIKMMKKMMTWNGSKARLYENHQCPSVKNRIPIEPIL